MAVAAADVPRAQPELLVDAGWAAVEVEVVRARGPPANAEQQARRALRDNFASWTESEVTVRVIVVEMPNVVLGL